MIFGPKHWASCSLRTHTHARTDTLYCHCLLPQFHSTHYVWKVCKCTTHACTYICMRSSVCKHLFLEKWQHVGECPALKHFSSFMETTGSLNSVFTAML